ncbi:MAG TPA: hypothetical protein VGB94_09960 [Acidobacteriaceae bacterium]
MQAISQTPSGGWNDIVAMGHTYHMSELEVFVTKAVPGGLADISYSQLQSWAADAPPSNPW